MFRRALEVGEEGAGEQAGLAAVQAGEGGDGREVRAEVAEPEADGGGIATGLGVTAGLLGDEAGEKLADGGRLEDEEEGPELGGVPPVLEGVEVALGGAGAGPPAASLAGGRTVGHWGPPLCLSTDRERINGWAGASPLRVYGRRGGREVGGGSGGRKFLSRGKIMGLYALQPPRFLVCL